MTEHLTNSYAVYMEILNLFTSSLILFRSPYSLAGRLVSSIDLFYSFSIAL